MSVSFIWYVVIIFTLYLVFSYFNMRGSWAEDRLIHHMIQTKDKLEISRVSFDAQTKKFLLSLPTSTIPEKTSDSQGGTSDSDYLVTTLNGNLVGVTISHNTSGFLGSLFPSYSLELIRLWGNVQK